MTIIYRTPSARQRALLYRAAKARQREQPARPIPPARIGSAWQQLKTRATAWLSAHISGLAPAPPATPGSIPPTASLLPAAGTAPMTPENLDNLAAEFARAAQHDTAAALRAASTSWRRSLADLAEAQRDNSLLQARINRARSQLADPAPEYRAITTTTTPANARTTWQHPAN